MKPPRLLALLLLMGVLACASPTGGRLTYAQVQSLNPGVSADWVRSEFPFGSVVRRADGTVESISFNVQDPRGRGQDLTLLFDEREILIQKRYTGRVVRPGGAQGGPTPSTR